MIKLSSLIEWKKYSVSHTDPIIVKAREEDVFRRHFPHLYKDPWRGPHDPAIVTLMISGKKPAAIINLPKDKQTLEPYIRAGKLVAKESRRGSLIVAQPNEKWRIDKIINLLNSISPGTPASDVYHAKLGILLGYSKDDILSFIQSRRKDSY